MIIATNINQLTMSSAFDTLTTDKGTVELYLKELMNRPINSKDAYVDFTEICFLYNKKAINYLKLDKTKELIEVAKEVDNIKIPLIKTIRGRAGKTFLHYVLLLDALRWVDTRLAYEMDKVLREIFRQADIVKVHREECKTHFHPLTDAIKKHILPHISNEAGKRNIYATFMDFANKCVMGMSAKQFRELKAKEGVEVDKDETRCHFGDNNLDKIIEVEKKFYLYITEMGFTNFHQVKAFYLKRVNLINALTLSVDELKSLNLRIDRLEKNKKQEQAQAKIREIISQYF